MVLSKKSLNNIPESTFETYNGVIFPILRRLYRRVGSNFDIENMVTVLLEKVEKNKEELDKPVTKDNNTIVDFCVYFAPAVVVAWED